MNGPPEPHQAPQSQTLARNAASDAPHSSWEVGAAIQLFEGSRPWVQRTLWNLNRFWSQKPCQTGRLAKRLLLMLIELLLLATLCVILAPAPSVLKEGRSTRVSIHAKASAAKPLRSNGHLGRNDSPSPEGAEIFMTGRSQR